MTALLTRARSGSHTSHGTGQHGTGQHGTGQPRDRPARDRPARTASGTGQHGRLSRPVAFYLLASVIVSFLAGSSAPTPLYAVYPAKWGFSPITTTVVFGVYALAVLAALLTVGSLSDHVAGGRCCWSPSRSRPWSWWCSPPRTVCRSC